jgi:hypothetical protein
MRSKSRAPASAAALLQARLPDHAFPTTVRRYSVVTVKPNGTRVLFSRHETYAAAEALVAGLARIGCVAHVEFAVDDRRPGIGMTTPTLNDALLDFMRARSRIERSLGRGGAPFNLQRARDALPDVEYALARLAASRKAHDYRREV